MRAPEDRTSPHREVQLAGVAAIEATLAGRDALTALAGRALDPIRPQPVFDVLSSRLFIRESFKQLERAYR